MNTRKRKRPAQTTAGTKAKKRQTAANRAAGSAVSPSNEAVVSATSSEESLVEKVTSRVIAEIREELASLVPAAQQPENATDGTSVQGNSMDDFVPAEELSSNQITESDDSDDSSDNDEMEPRLQPLSIPLGVSVDSAIKKKIRANRYFDFSKLNPDCNKKKHYTLKLTQKQSEPAVKVSRDTDEGQHRLSLDDWTQHFYTFCAILTESSPRLAPSLMKYGHTIREMSHRRMDWLQYDQDFRKSYSGEVEIPWASLHTELFLLAKDTPYSRYPLNHTL